MYVPCWVKFKCCQYLCIPILYSENCAFWDTTMQTVFTNVAMYVLMWLHTMTRCCWVFSTSKTVLSWKKYTLIMGVNGCNKIECFSYTYVSLYVLPSGNVYINNNTGCVWYVGYQYIIADLVFWKSWGEVHLHFLSVGSHQYLYIYARFLATVSSFISLCVYVCFIDNQNQLYFVS